MVFTVVKSNNKIYVYFMCIKQSIIVLKEYISREKEVNMQNWHPRTSIRVIRTIHYVFT